MMTTDIWAICYYDANDAGPGGIIGTYTTFKEAQKKLMSIARSHYMVVNKPCWIQDDQGIVYHLVATILHS